MSDPSTNHQTPEAPAATARPRSLTDRVRSLRLPDTVDEGKVEARFESGVLKVTLPKRPEAGGAQRKIEIKKS